MTATLDQLPVMGRTEPRLGSTPLVTGPAGPCGCGCALSPSTSLGFDAIEFASEILELTLLPWQRWWLIHALELRLGGSYRFRTIITLVARQQGKTTLLKIVALWAMCRERAALVLGAAQSLDIARESWAGAVALLEDDPELVSLIAPNGVRRANGEQCLTLTSGARYRIAAATRSAGRGLSVDLLILDELREHRTSDAWAALSKTTMARPHALIVGISNAGDDQSTVLNGLRSAALAGADESLGIFEWSAPEGCALDDRDGWAQAMPGLGITISEAAVRTALVTDPPAVFRTELLCQHVPALDAAIDPAAWAACVDRTATLAPYRSRLALCVDVAPDGAHVTLAGAAVMEDGRVRVEVMGAWHSADAADQEIAERITKIAPVEIGWFPGAPVGVLGSTLRMLRRTVRRTIVKVDKDTGCVIEDDEHEATRINGGMDREACQGFADLVTARRLLHPGDDLLDAHVAGAQRYYVGDSYRFSRTGGGHCDAAYAAAGAVYLARQIPAEQALPRPRIF